MNVHDHAHFDVGPLDEFIGESRIARQRQAAVEAVAKRTGKGRHRAWVTVSAVAMLVMGLFVGWRAGILQPTSGKVELACPALDCVSKETLLAPGARVEMTSGAHASSERLAHNSYEVVIHRGRMTFDIDPARKLAWKVRAGRYVVEVIGTVFSVTRGVHSDELLVSVTRGRVKVVTSGSTTPVFVEGGQQFYADAQGLGVVRDSSAPSLSVVPTDLPVVPSAVRSETASPDEAIRPLPSSSVHAREEAEAGSSWQDLAERRSYAEAWSAARSEGLDRLLNTLGVKPLARLADVARFGGSPADAKQVLLTVRQRFPNAPAARDGAFFLARLEADHLGHAQDATTWFQTYLTEQPAGVFAQEARGRALLLLDKLGRTSEARAMARQYLERHPGGPYSASARRLMR